MINSGQMHYGMWEMEYSWEPDQGHNTLYPDGTYETGEGIKGEYWQDDGKIIIYQADTQSVFSGDVVDGVMVGICAEFTSGKRRGSWHAHLVK